MNQEGRSSGEFIEGLHGTLSLTFEEGTLAAWLHDLLKPHVSRLVVCDPRRMGGSTSSNLAPSYRNLHDFHGLGV